MIAQYDEKMKKEEEYFDKIGSILANELSFNTKISGILLLQPITHDGK